LPRRIFRKPLPPRFERRRTNDLERSSRGNQRLGLLCSKWDSVLIDRCNGSLVIDRNLRQAEGRLQIQIRALIASIDARLGRSIRRMISCLTKSIRHAIAKPLFLSGIDQSGP